MVPEVKLEPKVHFQDIEVKIGAGCWGVSNDMGMNDQNHHLKYIEISFEV